MDENDFARLFEPTETQVNMIYSMDREGTSPHRCHFKWSMLYLAVHYNIFVFSYQISYVYLLP